MWICYEKMEIQLRVHLRASCKFSYRYNFRYIRLYFGVFAKLLDINIFHSRCYSTPSKNPLEMYSFYECIEQLKTSGASNRPTALYISSNDLSTRFTSMLCFISSINPSWILTTGSVQLAYTFIGKHNKFLVPKSYY